MNEDESPCLDDKFNILKVSSVDKYNNLRLLDSLKIQSNSLD